MAESFQGVPAVAKVPSGTVRTKLLQTMVLGLPVDDANKPLFHWERVVEFGRHDREGSPWDWSVAPVLEDAPVSRNTICAYEFFEPLGRQGAYPTEVGDFNPTTLRVTLFEDQFSEVDGFSYVTVGPGDKRWWFRHWVPAVGLGSLTVFQVTCTAQGTD